MTWTTEQTNYGDWATFTYSAIEDLTTVSYADTGTGLHDENVTPSLHVGGADRLVFVPSAVGSSGDQINWDKAVGLVPQFSMDGVVWAEVESGSQAISIPTFTVVNDPATPQFGFSDYNAMYIRFRHDGTAYPGTDSATIKISVYKQYFGKAENKGRR